MKIGNNGADKAVNGANTATRTDAATNATTAGKTSSADSGVEASAKVTLSGTANGLSTSSEGSFDSAKVDRIKKAIDDGTYKVNADAIADKLIANAKEVLSRQ
ncbi:MAG TPA: flagellar biosynthesis anti-sigma factor FlgM [Candidatus Aquabacterium excrementipullorum]|nr:flagellar biosynthesis anti-sigma factor FlgM [Candidatus Aquabacterium excrementipullorum]